MRKFIPFSQAMIFRRDPAYIVFFIERRVNFLLKIISFRLGGIFFKTDLTFTNEKSGLFGVILMKFHKK